MAEAEKSTGSDNAKDILTKIENKSRKIESLIKQLKFLIRIRVSHLKVLKRKKKNLNSIGLVFLPKTNDARFSVHKALMTINDVEGMLHSSYPQYYDILMK
ncbi:hypothetical protein Goshw_013325 [Gossypium schwendimanii]|uniref:Uncharacterized protein n=1 Tax=Gossypium schwendimanii TaxID=34291 RepID=A0A7J9MBU8_GOSSC|nr:hypothetical protein [Gossypium schwendimanii]